jgi:xanthine dehydrogenase accessory factor
VTLDNRVDGQLAARAAELAAKRVPFVSATVVRAQAPTSARPGDRAIVLGDGSMEGFLGGHCAKESVRAGALAALRDGEPVLLRVLPGDADVFPEAPGAQVVRNPCLSGGALEIFLEPVLPPSVVRVVGGTPIANAVAGLAEMLGFDVDQELTGGHPTPGTVAVIVASHGHDEPAAIRWALDAGVGFVGLVASRTRGDAVLDEMGLSGAERARVHAPVGLPIGARTPEEIGLSIMAAVVQAVRVDGVTAGSGEDLPELASAFDPVCGMTVVIGSGTPQLSVHGADYWFCGAGCRDLYAARAGSG